LVVEKSFAWFCVCYICHGLGEERETVKERGGGAALERRIVSFFLSLLSGGA